MIIYIIGLILLLVCSGFFSGSETAVTAVSRARMQSLISQGNKRALLVAKLHLQSRKPLERVDVSLRIMSQRFERRCRFRLLPARFVNVGQRHVRISFAAVVGE